MSVVDHHQQQQQQEAGQERAACGMKRRLARQSTGDFRMNKRSIVEETRGKDCIPRGNQLVGVGEASKKAAARCVVAVEAAFHVVNQQIATTFGTDSCGVCCAKFQTHQEKLECLRNLTKRKQDVKQRLDAMRLNSRRCFGIDSEDMGRSDVYFRAGYVKCLKKIKAVVLMKRQCPGCKRQMSHTETTSLLSNIDRAALMMGPHQHLSLSPSSR